MFLIPSRSWEQFYELKVDDWEFVKMSTSHAESETFRLVWEHYRRWAYLSRKTKRELNIWRSVILILIVLGTLLGVFAQYFANETPGIRGVLSLRDMLVGSGGISLALAAFFSREILRSNRERSWIMARSIAEGLKSQVFKFATRTPPYNGTDGQQRLKEEAEKLIASGQGLWLPPLSNQEKLFEIPDTPMSIRDYIERRVDKQIHGYYQPNAIRCQRVVSIVEKIGWVLGAIGVIIGVLGTVFPSIGISGWLAVIGTLSASLGAFFYGGRYQYLTLSYQTTADRLKWLLADWHRLEPIDQTLKAGHKLVIALEITISAENRTWLAQVTNIQGELRQGAVADDESPIA